MTKEKLMDLHDTVVHDIDSHKTTMNNYINTEEYFKADVVEFVEKLTDEYEVIIRKLINMIKNSDVQLEYIEEIEKFLNKE